MKATTIRLKKIIGQLNWIIAMIEEGKDCSDIIVQFQAAKWALSSAFSTALNENLNACLENKNKKDVEKIIKLIAKL